MVINSSKLILSSLSDRDFPFYARLVTDARVMRYITGSPLTLEDARLRFNKALFAGKGFPEAGFFLATKSADNEPIGIAKLVSYDRIDCAEIGYMLIPNHWGKGYATEMVFCMLHLALDKNSAKELIGIVDPENLASIRVLTKFGFELYESGQIDGLDAAYYRLLLGEL